VSAQPSEATRLAELDARIARDCERSGVPFFVEDDGLLDRVAGLLADNPPSGIGLPSGGSSDRT
jgi:hypothetical protein